MIKKKYHIPMYFFIAINFLIWNVPSGSTGADFLEFDDVRFVHHTENSGDRFLVTVSSGQFWVTIRFIDCPEVTLHSTSDSMKVIDQQYYWGIRQADSVVAYGIKACSFVATVLAPPFRLKMMVTGDNIVGMVQTSDDSDLAALLVEHGYARVHQDDTVAQSTIDIATMEIIEKLRDLELLAIMNRAGIWALTDTSYFLENRPRYRASHRSDILANTLIEGAPAPTILLNLNTATHLELQQVKGIGPALAARIIAARPFKSVADLKKVKGVGTKVYQKISPYFFIDILK